MIKYSGMKLRTILFIGLSIYMLGVKSQADLRPGYVIELTGDTAFGLIDYRGDLLMSTVCNFKNSNNELFRYVPADIKSYRFVEGKYYISWNLNEKKVFLEYLIKGKVNIYYQRDDKGEHYYMDKATQELVELVYEKGVEYAEERRVFFETTRHIGLLNYYMQDAPELRDRINSINKPSHQSLISLAEDYHNIICKGEECLVYEKKLPLLKVSVVPFIGITKFRGYENFIPSIGGYVYFWSPRANEKLYFKSGVVSLKSTQFENITQVYKIPIQFQYIFRAKKLQPKISGGINFYSDNLRDFNNLRHTLSLNAGLDYQLLKRLSLSTSFNSDHVPLLVAKTDDEIDFKVISYSFIVGVRIDL
jgi:hypothetical protein